MEVKNRWTLTDEVREKVKPVVQEFINKIESYYRNELEEMADDYDQISVDLSDMGICPYHLWKVLEEDFGYTDHNLDHNGWELDFWIRFKKKGKIDLMIQGCGMTSELKLCYEVY